MKGATVSIDRIVIDFTIVYWDFFSTFDIICKTLNINLNELLVLEDD
jgi:hypothetical protein